ncbi:MAG: hypothetical protein ACLT0Y_02175 [Christensenellales bacterium]
MTAPEPPVHEDIYTKERLLALAESQTGRGLEEKLSLDGGY